MGLAMAKMEMLGSAASLTEEGMLPSSKVRCPFVPEPFGAALHSLLTYMYIYATILNK